MKCWTLDPPRGKRTPQSWSPDTLAAHELAVIYFRKITSLNRKNSWLTKIRAQTSRVVLSAPLECIASDSFSQFLKNNPVFAVAAQMELAEQAGEYLGRAVPGDFQSDLLKLYEDLQNRFGKLGIQLIPEIILKGNLLDLGPTLVELAQFKCPWLVLRPNGPPDHESVVALKNCFEYLEIRNFPDKDIYFSFDDPIRNSWSIATRSPFTGLREVHIDISNRCTHSCVFCGLYGPAAIAEIKAKNNGTISESMRQYMRRELPFAQIEEIITSLPETVESIQFGGNGDPMMHGQALECIRIARERNISVSILSNMEYLDAPMIQELTDLGSIRNFDLHFIANLSAPNQAAYLRTRPRQTAASFQKVIGNLKMISDLRTKNRGKGAFFTLMCVVNRHNFREIKEYIQLAKELKASRVWFKALEIHGPGHRELMLSQAEAREYEKILASATHYAKKNQVRLFDGADYAEY